MQILGIESIARVCRATTPLMPFYYTQAPPRDLALHLGIELPPQTGLAGSTLLPISPPSFGDAPTSCMM